MKKEEINEEGRDKRRRKR